MSEAASCPIGWDRTEPPLVLLLTPLLMDDVSGQAAQAGDAQTADAGHEIPFIPEKEQQAAQEEQAKQPQTEEEGSDAADEDAKAWRKSSKKWQEMVEKVDNFEKITEALSQSLGIKVDEKAEEELPVKLQREIESLKEETKRKDWEIDHPLVRTPEVRDEWNEIVKAKGHLVRSGDLTYDDLWRLVRKEPPTATSKEYRSQELNIGSIPPASKATVATSGIDPEVESWLKMKGYSDKQIKMSGL